MREVLGAEESHLCAWKGRSKMSYHIRLRTNANLARRRGNLVRYHAQKPWGYVSMPKKASESTEKTTKDRAEERSEAGKTYLFFCQRKVVKNR